LYLCGDAVPGLEMTSKKHTVNPTTSQNIMMAYAESRGVKGGVQYEQMMKQCSNNSVKYKIFYKKNKKLHE
jgi:hypothetical protein